MSGLWDKVKSAGTQTKLKGEIALHEREKTARKKRFGVELYELLAADKGAAFSIKAPAIFHANEEQIRIPFEQCQADLTEMQVTRNHHEQQIDMLRVNRDRAVPAFTARDKMNQAGQWMSSTTNEGKLQAQIALLDRQMKQRKETFGLDVFDLLEYAPERNGSPKKGPKGAFSGAFSKFSEKEKLIEEVVASAKKDVDFIQRRIEFKQNQIVELGGNVRVEF